MSKLLTLCASHLRPGNLLFALVELKFMYPSRDAPVSMCLTTIPELWYSTCEDTPLVMQEDIVERFGKKAGRLEEGPPAIAVT